MALRMVVLLVVAGVACFGTIASAAHNARVVLKLLACERKMGANRATSGSSQSTLLERSVERYRNHAVASAKPSSQIYPFRNGSRGRIDMKSERQGRPILRVMRGETGAWEVQEAGFETPLSYFRSAQDAKDYAGAAVVAAYFAVALIGLSAFG
jgi:hypothetical protein